MTREETKKCIEVMQAYVDGKEIERRWVAEREEEWRSVETPNWFWNTHDYRVKPKNLKVTEEEKEIINNPPIFWAKHKETGEINSHFGHAIESFKKDHYILNPTTMEWEDRSKDTERLKHHYNGGQP